MKICPTCRKTYADDNLNFCLEDGSVLTFGSNEPPATVMMGQPRPTDPTAVFPSTPNTGIQSTFGQQASQPYTMQQPKKSSKAWLWIVGIVGIILLLCGGGFAGLVFIGMQADRNQGNNSTYPPNNGRGNTSASPAPSPFSSTNTSSSDVETIDLSFWVKDSSVWGTTEMSGDEFLMAAKQKGYYYVLVAPDDYTTDGKNVRVTVRNVDNANSSLGYGLIFHSATLPLTKDYAFLIDAKRKKYRVVRHESSRETTIVSWKDSSAIKDGTQENILEARDKGDTIELYINNEMVTSIKDQYGQANGVPGLYSGDGAKIGFKKLEIWK
ncbi:MAG TPA: hypothetical protein VFO86_10915 [Terriglobia bacterium]|jgi:hypothetical protein|nr:hypothetical protein [Terriglobia bacterium]